MATTIADWTPVTDRVKVVCFTGHLAAEDDLAEALADSDIVATLRERVPINHSAYRHRRIDDACTSG